MKRSAGTRQGGMSAIGLIIILAILAAVGVVVAQAIPTALEYQAVVKAVNRAVGAGTPVQIRDAFDRSTAVDDIKSITSKELEITREGDKYVVKFAYNKEIPMFGPAYLLLKYAGQAKQP